MTKENLNTYRDAYRKAFTFYDENVFMLSWYSQKISQVMREQRYASLISLGIGHKIVCKTLAFDPELKDLLEKYIILEGSSEIIKDFQNEIQLPCKLHIVNSLFEDFYTEEKFDAIEMGFILEHVDNPAQLLRQYAKFLKPSGRLFIAVPNAQSLHRLIGHQAGILDNIYRLSTYDIELGHKRYFDLELLVNLINESGLQIINKAGLFLKPFSTTQLQSLQLSQKVIDAFFHVGERYPEISNAIYIEAASSFKQSCPIP